MAMERAMLFLWGTLQTLEVLNKNQLSATSRIWYPGHIILPLWYIQYNYIIPLHSIQPT